MTDIRYREEPTTSLSEMPLIDDLLLQEIYSLREQMKIMAKMLKYYEPDLDVSMLMHSLGHCDYTEYLEG